MRGLQPLSAWAARRRYLYPDVSDYSVRFGPLRYWKLIHVYLDWLQVLCYSYMAARLGGLLTSCFDDSHSTVNDRGRTLGLVLFHRAADHDQH